MASKAGARAAGTDGSDFAFRQTVDSKYQRAADARAGCKRLLSLLLVYFPAQLMFYVGPIVMNKADVANGRVTPFAACAFVGFALTFAAHAHVRGNKLNARWLGGITKASERWIIFDSKNDSILFSVRSIRSAVSARPPRGGRVSRSNPNPTYPTPNPKRRPRR